jgi:hypothetical protein
MTKLMKRHASLAALLCGAVLVSACGDSAVQKITAPAAPAAIKFFNFGVGAPGVNFYANSTKMTAIGSTTGVEATTGVVYGGVGAGGLYTGIEPGQYTLTGRIAATTDKDLAIATIPLAVQNGKNYSFYLSGFYIPTTKVVDAFVVEDNFAEPTDFSVATVRFVNAISNANPMTLYAKNSLTTAAEIAIGGEIAYKGAGAFTTIPAGAYNLSTRYAGATTNALTRPTVGFSGGRVYTITARGDITSTPSTACAAANRTCLDNTTNR